MPACTCDNCDFPLSTANEVVQKSKEADTDESKKVVGGEKERENENEKPVLDNSEVIKKEAQEKNVKPEEDVVKTEVAEPVLGRDGSDEGVRDGQKQEETKSVVEK